MSVTNKTKIMDKKSKEESGVKEVDPITEKVTFTERQPTFTGLRKNRL